MSNTFLKFYSLVTAIAFFVSCYFVLAWLPEKPWWSVGFALGVAALGTVLLQLRHVRTETV